MNCDLIVFFFRKCLLRSAFSIVGQRCRWNRGMDQVIFSRILLKSPLELFLRAFVDSDMKEESSCFELRVCLHRKFNKWFSKLGWRSFFLRFSLNTVLDYLHELGKKLKSGTFEVGKWHFWFLEGTSKQKRLIDWCNFKINMSRWFEISSTRRLMILCPIHAKAF